MKSKDVKYYSLRDNSPEEIMENFFEEEERAELLANLDSGAKIAGVIDENTTEEEKEAILAKVIKNLK